MKQETIDRIRKFTEDREWEQFHSPGNLAKSIVIEAAELLECFQWNDKEMCIRDRPGKVFGHRMTYLKQWHML